MKAIQVQLINKLNTRKLRTKLNHRVAMLVLFLLANVAVSVSFGRAGVTLGNNRKLITIPDDLNLNQLIGLLSGDSEVIIENKKPLLTHFGSNQNQNKKSVVVNPRKSNTETTASNKNFPVPVDIDNTDFSELVNLIISKSGNAASSNLDLSNLELLLKLHRALLRGEILTTSTTTVPTTTTISTSTSTSSPVDKVTISKLKLKNDLKHFVHEMDDLKQMLDLNTDEEEEKKDADKSKWEDSEKNVALKTKKSNPKPTPDLVSLPKAKPESPEESVSVNKLLGRKLGINIPVFRIKVDDKVPISGRAEITVNVDEFKPFFWALAIFLSLLFVAIVLGCIFGVVFLQKMQARQFREFQNQNQVKELHSRGCTSTSVSVRDRERRLSRFPPACRCGCEDDITKSHLADIIRRDFDRDSGTSSQVGGTSVV